MILLPRTVLATRQANLRQSFEELTSQIHGAIRYDRCHRAGRRRARRTPLRRPSEPRATNPGAVKLSASHRGNSAGPSPTRT